MKKLIVLIAAAASVFFISCSSSNQQSSRGKRSLTIGSDSQNMSSTQKKLLTAAEQYIGVPYCYGGASPDCMDCSGFVMQVFDEIGVAVPRTSQRQFAASETVSHDEATIGDLVFFKFNGKTSHVGLFAGNNRVIHASSSRGVIVQSLSDSYLSQWFIGVRRILSSDALP